MDLETANDVRTVSDEPGSWIGPLTREERLLKVRSYLNKKLMRRTRKNVRYHCRKVVAQQRLRIKGRFMTRVQALAELGLTQDQLMENSEIQRLLTDHHNNKGKIEIDSMFEKQSSNGNKALHKICNLQVLLDMSRVDATGSVGSKK